MVSLPITISQELFLSSNPYSWPRSRRALGVPATGVEFDRFFNDAMLQDAVVRNLETNRRGRAAKSLRLLRAISSRGLSKLYNGLSNLDGRAEPMALTEAQECR
jgi:hypothetical protein